MKIRADAAVDSALDVRDADLAAAADAGRDTANSPPDSSVDAMTTMATITFRFKNTGTNTVYLHRGCTIPLTVTSLADGATYGNGYACVCDCASPSCNGAMECGECAPDSGIPIAVGATEDVTWTARRTITRTKSGPYGSFRCEEASPIPTGAYKVAIDVFSSDSDAANRTNSRFIEQSFNLGTADDTIEVVLL
jgi:hypothetical protein